MKAKYLFITGIILNEILCSGHLPSEKYDQFGAVQYKPNMGCVF